MLFCLGGVVFVPVYYPVANVNPNWLNTFSVCFYVKNAKACTDRNAGCAVFDRDGKAVYGAVKITPEDMTDL